MTLKGKLAKKLEVVDLHPTEENTNISANEYKTLENNAMVKFHQQEGDNQLTQVVPDFAITINQARERIIMLQNFVKEMMIPDVDYGMIPKCKKPSLFKSGAEKLCDIFGFSKRIEVINRLENWEKGIFHYEVKAILLNKRTGYIEAEGVGSCNSREAKYSNQNAFSIVNTILKMAKKRALIDAVLSATRSSDIFTQDVEDLTLEYTNHSFSSSSYPNNKKINPTSNEVERKQQLKELYTLVSLKNIDVEEMKQFILKNYGVKDSKQLTEEQVRELINKLRDL